MGIYVSMYLVDLYFTAYNECYRTDTVFNDCTYHESYNRRERHSFQCIMNLTSKPVTIKCTAALAVVRLASSFGPRIPVNDIMHPLHIQLGHQPGNEPLCAISIILYNIAQH